MSLVYVNVTTTTTITINETINMMVASSFVEEEHQTVYFLDITCTILFALFAASNIYSRGTDKFGNFRRLIELLGYVILLGMCRRISRTWNQSGNKWLAEEDVVKILTRDPNNRGTIYFLAVLSIIGIISLSGYWSYRAMIRTPNKIRDYILNMVRQKRKCDLFSKSGLNR